MAIKKSSNSGIPFGNTAGRPTAATGQPYFNGELGRLEVYTSTGWQNIVQETPGVASVSGTYNQSTGSGTFTISGTNFVSGGLVFAVGTNGTEYAATTSTTNSIVQMTALFTGLSAAYEPYDIKVLNPSNLFGLLPDAFYINESPIWSTTSGSLGNIVTGNSVSIQLSATDPESNALTYSLSSGSLPGGLSLSSSGLISGTASGNTSETFNFTISVSDSSNSLVSRSFSLGYTAVPFVTGGTLTSDATYYYRTFTASSTLSVSNLPITAEMLIVAGGGGGRSGGNGGDGGGGAGGLVYHSSKTLTTQSYPIVIGGGGAGNGGGSGEASQGGNTTFSDITAIGGGGGGASGGSAGGGVNINNQPNTGCGNAQGSALQGNSGGGIGYGNGGGQRHENHYQWAGGGGGGAGGAGQNNKWCGGPSGSASQGGVGKTYNQFAGKISSGHDGGFAGGGSGGHENYTNNVGYSVTASVGFGGAATDSTGTANTGGGGGGDGFAGGSGAVIIRYTRASVGG